MEKNFCLIVKVFTSSKSPKDKPLFARQLYVESPVSIDFSRLVESFIFLFGRECVMSFEVSPLTEMIVK